MLHYDVWDGRGLLNHTFCHQLHEKNEDPTVAGVSQWRVKVSRVLLDLFQTGDEERLRTQCIRLVTGNIFKKSRD